MLFAVSITNIDIVFVCKFGALLYLLYYHMHTPTQIARGDTSRLFSYAITEALGSLLGVF